MIIDEHGRAYNTVYRGENLDYWITGRIAVMHETFEDTIRHAKYDFNTFHRIAEWDGMERVGHWLSDGCILGEAYINATLRHNKGKLDGIPPMELYLSEVEKLFNRYIKNGWVISEEWLNAIKGMRA